VLVFADREVEPRLERVDAQTLRLWLENAVLADSAPRTLAPALPGEVLRVELSESQAAGRSFVLVEIRGTRALEDATVSRELSTLAVEVARRGPSPGEGIVLALRDTALADVVRSVGDATGVRFVYDERLEGRITLAAPARVTREEALGLLDAALAVAGFVAVPARDGTRRVLPANLGPSLAPWKPGALAGDAEAPVATLVRLENARAEELVPALLPWLGGAIALAQTPGNAVLLAGPERRLHALVSMLRSLDEAAAEPVWVRRLEHGRAEDVAEWLRLEVGGLPGTRPRAGVWADARSNALIVRASPDEVDRLRARVAELDQPERFDGLVRVLRVRHADVDDLAERLRALAAAADAPGGEALAGRFLSVAVDRPTHSLIVAADPETQQVVEDVVRELDRPPPRVAVDAMVVEVLTEDSLELGFDAFLPLLTPKKFGDAVAGVLLDPTGGGLPQPGAGAGPAFAARYTREPLVIPIIDSNGNPVDVLVPRESAVLTADGRDLAARTLMQPHLVVASGDEQEIFAGDQVPIPVASSTPGNALEVRQTIQRQDVGVRMRVRPSLGQANVVRLELDLEVSRVVPSPISLGTDVGPRIQQRRIQSTVVLGDGEIAVVGLAREQGLDSTESGTPYLKDVPVLGTFFRATRESRRHSELVVTVRARVLRDDADVAAEGIRRRLGVERVLARAGALEAGEEPSWAVRVASLGDERGAQELAERLAGEGLAARSVPWTWEGLARFDVYATGFARLADATAAASRLGERGFDAELVAVPARDP